MSNRNAVVSVALGIGEDVIGIELIVSRNRSSLNWIFELLKKKN
ncbi:hypothetical protein ACTFOB_07765 [Bacillus cereus group sp. MYBK79-1]